MHLDIVDKQSRTIVAFKLKVPLSGFGYVEKPVGKNLRSRASANLGLLPFKAGSEVELQSAVGEGRNLVGICIMVALVIESRNRGQAHWLCA